MSHDGWTQPRRADGLAVRALGRARRRHLGDPRRPAGLRLRPADVLGRLRPGHPAGPGSRPPGRPRPVDRARATPIYHQIMDRGFHPKREAFVQHYDTEVLDASLLYMPLVELHRADRPALAVDAAGDGRRTRLRQPRLPLRPGRVAGRAARLRGHLHDLLVLVRRRAGPLRPARRRPAHLREDADLQQPPRAVLRGDRPDRRADRQLPAGLQPSLAHQRGDEPRLPARPRRRVGSSRCWTSASRCNVAEVAPARVTRGRSWSRWRWPSSSAASPAPT